MRFELPALPFERHSLEPAISRAQIDLLYSHHHRHQLDLVNAAVDIDEARSLEALADAPDTRLAEAAAQAWALTFFWHGLTARPAAADAALSRRVVDAFADWGALQAAWRARILASDSHWSWLAMPTTDRLTIMETSNGKPPAQATPLVAVALMPDAYRLDFGSDRGAYFDALWPCINWEFAALNLHWEDARHADSPEVE